MRQYFGFCARRLKAAVGLVVRTRAAREDSEAEAPRADSGAFGVADAVWILFWLLTWAGLVAEVWTSYAGLSTWAKVGLSIGVGIPAAVFVEFSLRILDEFLVLLGLPALFRTVDAPEAAEVRQTSTPGDTDEAQAEPSVWPVYVVAATTAVGSLSLPYLLGGLDVGVAIMTLPGLATSWGLVRLRTWAWYCASLLTIILGSLYLAGLGFAALAPVSARQWLLLAAGGLWLALLIWSLKTRRQLFFPPG